MRSFSHLMGVPNFPFSEFSVPQPFGPILHHSSVIRHRFMGVPDYAIPGNHWHCQGSVVCGMFCAMAEILQIKVSPRSRESVLVRKEDGSWAAKLKSPPVDGKANTELIGLVADYFHCRKAEVSIMTGASSRLKRVRVECP